MDNLVEKKPSGDSVLSGERRAMRFERRDVSDEGRVESDEI
jgi:hypothetical protein